MQVVAVGEDEVNESVRVLSAQALRVTPPGPRTPFLSLAPKDRSHSRPTLPVVVLDARHDLSVFNHPQYRDNPFIDLT